MGTDDRVGRRDFMRKAAVAGTGAFAIPMIITVEPADAQAVTSPPPEPPRGSQQPKVEIEGGAPGVGAPPGRGAREQAGRQPAQRQEPGGGMLPLTGFANLENLAKAGLAATAGGAALTLWSAKASSKAEGSTVPNATDPTTPTTPTT